MNNLLRLRSIAKSFSTRQYSPKYILDAENRQLYEDIFPDICM